MSWRKTLSTKISPAKLAKIIIVELKWSKVIKCFEHRPHPALFVPISTKALALWSPCKIGRFKGELPINYQSIDRIHLCFIGVDMFHKTYKQETEIKHTRCMLSIICNVHAIVCYHLPEYGMKLYSILYATVCYNRLHAISCYRIIGDNCSAVRRQCAIEEHPADIRNCHPQPSNIHQTWAPQAEGGNRRSYGPLLSGA